MPSNFSLKAPAIFSATERSIAVYQTTLPSCFAASISCGVIASAGGASARAGAANTAPRASAVEPFSAPCRISRRDGLLFFMVSSCRLVVGACGSGAGLALQRAAPLGRQIEPDLGAARHRVFGRRDDAQHRAVRRLDHVIAAGTEKDLPRYGGLDGILGRGRRLGRKRDVVLADGDRGALAGAEFRAH